jgi:hypothetical protein
MIARKRTVSDKPNLRCVADRRLSDEGPPCGWRERRRNVERRMPIVREDEISQTEWFRCMASYLARRRAEQVAIQKAFEELEDIGRLD